MGAQSAALLLSGAVLGEPLDVTVRLTATLEHPVGYLLDQVARSHGGAGLAPTAYDGSSLTTVLPHGARARVLPDLTVELDRPADLAVLRRVLDLDTDLRELWAVAPAHRGQGWQLRASSPFEALAQSLAATNTSYRSTQAMLRELVGHGPFPQPAEVADRELTRWGYRLPALRTLAERVDDVDWDGLDDEAVHETVLELPGFGPFAAASALPLLGRPRPLLLDGWLARQVPDPTRYEGFGRWGGTIMWLDVSRQWLQPGHAAPHEVPA